MKKGNIEKIHKAWKLINEAYELLDEAHAEENSKYEEKSERWRNSEKGEAFGSMLGEIEEAMTELWNAGFDLDNVLKQNGVDTDKDEECAA